MTKDTTRCMYCNSTSYGFGCAHSPHKKHVHISDGSRCIYCGSTNLGSGCPHNPFSNKHLRGAEYNMLGKESVYNSAIAGVFLSRLTQPITEMKAYKLGIIDESGRKIRDCITEEDHNALTTIDRQIIKIRRLISEDVIDLFQSNVLLELANESSNQPFDMDKYEKEVKLQSDAKRLVEDMESYFTENMDLGFSRNIVENNFIEAILKLHEDGESK